MISHKRYKREMTKLTSALKKVDANRHGIVARINELMTLRQETLNNDIYHLTNMSKEGLHIIKEKQRERNKEEL